MATLFKLNAYDIQQCGYYRRGSEAPEFGTLDVVLQDMEAWKSGKRIREALTFTPPDGSDVLPVYCFDLRSSSTGRLWMLTTWNETPTAEGMIQAVRGSSLVGDADVSATETSPDDIQGFPTMFLFVPEHSLAFSIRPATRRHVGHDGLVDFLNGYLKNASSFVVRSSEPSDIQGTNEEILGYRADASGDPLPLFPRFRSHPLQLPGQADFLRQNLARINKLVRRDTLSFSVVKERNLVAQLLENAGLLNPVVSPRDFKLGYKVDFLPTLDEFNALVASAATEAGSPDHPQLGFVLRGESEVRWLSHAFAKADWELPVDADELQLFDVDALLVQLEGRLPHLEALAQIST